MSLLSQVESLLRGIFEGGFRRLFSPRLQPLEIAHALEEVMEREKLVGPATLEVPNRYVARLNPFDLERFAASRNSTQREIASYLDRRADEAGFRPIGRIRVELVADDSVPRSFVRGEGSFEDADELDQGEVQETRRLEAVAAPAPARTLIIRAEDGQELRVAGRPVRIGRGPENDLILRDVRVSRQHAAIEPDGDAWLLRDLVTTNGTYLDGRRVEAARLDTSAEISLGGYRLSVWVT